jgi:hypothetical protein
MSDKIKEIKKDERVLATLFYDGKVVRIRDHTDILYHSVELKTLKKQLLRYPSLHSIDKALEELDEARRILREENNG